MVRKNSGVQWFLKDGFGERKEEMESEVSREKEQ